MQNSILFQENIAILKPFLRQKLFQILINFTGSKYKAVGSAEGGDLNFVSSQGPFYQPNALVGGYNKAQSFIKNPQQIKMSDELDVPIQMNNLAVEYNNGLMQDVKEQYPLTTSDCNDTAYLICLGIGAGFHLPFLTAKFNFREIIFLEPDFELFFNSLHHFNWKPLVDQIKIRGGRLTFLFEDNPVIAHAAITGYMRDRNYGLIEGSYIYQHYMHPTFLEIRTRIAQSGSSLLSYNGWMEDEILHLKNHITNFSSKECTLFDNKPSTLNSLLGVAVVVGSGPSLNDSIETLKQHRNDITIFSCGTSLGPLLTNGIEPDFHCELENVAIVYDFILQLSKLHNLENITLVASSTMNPNAASLFKKVMFFVREGDGVMACVNPEITQLDNVGPSATNTAIRVATQMGYSKICLFGTDFGAVNKEKEYANGVVYKNLNTINQIRRLKGEDPLASGGSAFHDLATVVEGNFGNAINTNSLLLDMKNRLEISIIHSQNDVYNCSDGVKIKRTKTCDNLVFSNLISAFPKKNIFSASNYAPVTAVKFENILRIKDALEQHLCDISDELERFVNITHSRFDISELYDILSGHMVFEYTETDSSFDKEIRGMITGSLMKMFHLIRYYYCRSGPLKDEFLRHSVTKFIDYIPLFNANSSGFIDHTLASLNYTNGHDCDEKKNFAVYFVQGNSNFSWKYSENINNFFSQDDEHLRMLLNEIISDDTTSTYILIYLFAHIAKNQILHKKLKNTQHKFMFSLLQRIQKPSSRLLGTAATYFCFAGYMDLALELTQKMKKIDKLPNRNIWNANMLLLNGRIEEAHDIFKKLPDYEDIPNIINLNSIALYMRGQVDDALDYLEKQMKNPDAMGACLYFKSFLLEKIGEKEFAELTLKEAQEVFPNWESRALFLFNIALNARS